MLSFQQTNEFLSYFVGKSNNDETLTLSKSETLELTYLIYPPRAARVASDRQSTWMNPIIDGEEASKMKGRVNGTEFCMSTEYNILLTQGMQETNMMYVKSPYFCSFCSFSTIVELNISYSTQVFIHV